MHILIATGAFKHSMTAQRAAEAVAGGLRASGLSAHMNLLPIADGGNGTLDAFLATGGERIVTNVEDPLGRAIPAAYGLLPDGATAVIEMALASGLELLHDDERDPFVASTYGTGQLMAAALAHGARRFIIGMGGSATVDGGVGCLMALGLQLVDADGLPIVRGAAGLAQIAEVDHTTLDPRWKDCEIIIASDVQNPALGSEGAAAVFGIQKGAAPQDLAILDAHLTQFFDHLVAADFPDVRAVAGSGAAGALAGGLLAVLGGRIQSGVELLLETNGFQEHLKTADVVITGEGRMDAQTIYGKGPIGVARMAANAGKPVIAFVGGLDVADILLHEQGITAAFPIVDRPMALGEAIARAEELLERAALRLGWLIKTFR